MVISTAGLDYRQINTALWEVWDDKQLICYQIGGGPMEPCLIVTPDVFESMLAAR